MYPYLRVLKTLITSRLNPAIRLNETGILRMRAGLMDIDNFGEINNGRQLTLMDLGRYDLAVRSGLLKIVTRNKWGLAIGGSSVRYRRRIPFLKCFEMRSRVVGHDGRWFYFLQELWCEDQICTSALIKGGMISKDGLIPAPEVLLELPGLEWNQDLPDWVQAWIEAESQRPWPHS